MPRTFQWPWNGKLKGVMSVRGLSGAEYYWNRPDKTEETMRDGWLYTGDRFTRDADGSFHGKRLADGETHRCASAADAADWILKNSKAAPDRVAGGAPPHA